MKNSDIRYPITLDYEDYWQYREKYQKNNLKQRELIFFEWIGNKVKVLALGCGKSLLLKKLALEKECLVSGIDISAKVVKFQQNMGINASKADITDKNFSIKGQYDYIILSEVLEHIPNPEYIVSKAIKKSSYLLISIPNSAFYRYRVQLALGGNFPKQWTFHPAEHLRYWSHYDFNQWLNNQGMITISFKTASGILLFKNLWPNLFGHQLCYLVKKK